VESFCDTLVEKAVAELGGLDILVNNAGRQQYCESIDDLTTADFDATFKTNVYAPFWITKAALRHLQEGAVIINTTSVQAFKPSAILVDYGGGQPQSKVQKFGEDTPLGRPGQPVEIAPLYVLFASDTCSYASGQVWCSDGGTGVL